MVHSLPDVLHSPSIMATLAPLILMILLTGLSVKLLSYDAANDALVLISFPIFFLYHLCYLFHFIDAGNDNRFSWSHYWHG